MLSGSKRDEEINQLEIEKNQKVKLSQTAAFRKIEDAAIVVNRELDELRIAARKFVEKFEIERNKEVEIIDKERLIAVINKSIEEAVAKTEAANAMKMLAATEEQIVSAREQEAAERVKRISLIEAGARTERESHRMVSIATAEKEATEQRALAEIAEANAAAVRYEREAEGQTQAQRGGEHAQRRRAAQRDLREFGQEPAEHHTRNGQADGKHRSSIKILQVDGVPGINSPSETARRRRCERRHGDAAAT